MHNYFLAGRIHLSLYSTYCIEALNELECPFTHYSNKATQLLAWWQTILCLNHLDYECLLPNDESLQL